MREPISHEEAQEIALRFIHAFFDTHPEARPVAHIPAREDLDSDLRLGRYIREQRDREKRNAEEITRLRRVVQGLVDWLDSPALARISVIADTHGFGIQDDETREAFAVIAEARDLLKQTKGW